MTAVHFVILALATWRLASLLAEEEGPGGILERIRYRVGVRYDEHSYTYGTNVVAEQITCIWCSTPWIGALIVLLYALAPTAAVGMCLPLALSAVAIAFNARGIRFRKRG